VAGIAFRRFGQTASFFTTYVQRTQVEEISGDVD
jgi:hypothetical protein